MGGRDEQRNGGNLSGAEFVDGLEPDAPPARHLPDEEVDLVVPQFGGALGAPVAESSLALTSSYDAAAATAEIQAALVMAKRFPRDEDEAMQRVQRACRRFSFAEKASYAYPRGKKQDPVTGKWVDNIVEGPSIYLAREVAKFWRNIRTSVVVASDTDDWRTIRATAWDLEANYYSSQESTFKKLIQRKRGKGENRVTEWVKPDERDLRELTAKHGSLALRAALLQLVPVDVIEFARALSRDTVEKKIKDDPDFAKRLVLLAFDQLNVPVADLERVIGCKIGQASPSQIADLRGLHSALKEGAVTMADVLAELDTEQEGRGSIDLSRFRARQEPEPEPPAGESQEREPGDDGGGDDTKDEPRELDAKAIARVIAACREARVEPDRLDAGAVERYGCGWRKVPAREETWLLREISRLAQAASGGRGRR